MMLIEMELSSEIIEKTINDLIPLEEISIKENPELKNKYNVTLEVSSNVDGNVTNLRLLKGKSNISEELLKNINNMFSQMIIPIKNIEASRVAVDIGNIGEEKVFKALRDISIVNKDFNVHDTSSLKDHGDMCVNYKNKKICIEVKNYSNPVPLKEVDKFHRSVSLPDYDYGIFIQLNSCGIAREANISTPIDVKTHNNKICFYLVDIDLKLLYPIITLLLDINTLGIQDSTLLDKKIKIIKDINNYARNMNLEIEKTKKSILRMETNLQSILALSLD